MITYEWFCKRLQFRLMILIHYSKNPDYIFTIENPEFEKHIPDTYLTELQLNKANTSDKETFFLDLNIKGIGSDVHTKREDFGYPIVNFPWLTGDVPRLPSYGVYNSQLVKFARALAFRISILKIFNSLPNYLRRVTDITSFEKHSESSSGHILTCCLNLVIYRFKNMLWKESLTGSSMVIKSTN